MTWRDDLPADLRDDPSISDIPDVTTLAKSYRDGQKQIGKLSQDAIRRPDSEAGKEEIAAAIEKVTSRWPELMVKPDPADPEQALQVLKGLGLPEAPDAYELPDAEEAVIAAHVDELNNLREIGHKAGLTKQQFKALSQAILDQQVSAQETAAGQLEEARGKLKAEWGGAYEERMGQVKFIAEKTGAPKALIEGLDNGTASPETIRWMHDMAKALAGEASEIQKQMDSAQKLTPAEAAEKIAAIRGNKDHDYYHPERGEGHRMAKKKMLELYEIKQAENYKGNVIKQ